MTVLVKKSKRLSWLLRHGALESGLAMDAAGWASVRDVCRLARMSERELDKVIEQNNKGRLRRVGDRVRCCQGHSMGGVPVTQEALEASWTVYTAPGPIVHGTSVSAAEAILETGIDRRARSHVHLATSSDSHVGKRANVAVELDIDPGRLEAVWISENGVVLARFVPPDAIIGIRGLTRNGRAALGRLRERLAVS